MTVSLFAAVTTTTMVSSVRNLSPVLAIHAKTEDVASMMAAATDVTVQVATGATTVMRTSRAPVTLVLTMPHVLMLVGILTVSVRLTTLDRGAVSTFLAVAVHV